MKLSIVCSESRKSLLPKLRESMDVLFMETLTWVAPSPGRDSFSWDALDRCLEYSVYSLTIIGPEDFNSSWVHYLCGYQKGRSDKLVVYSQDDQADLPEWARRYTVLMGGIADVVHYYGDLEKSWDLETRHALARRTLSDLELEPSVRSFAECVEEGDRFKTGLFLDAGFSPMLKNASGVPLLNIAIRHAHMDLVEPLMFAGADTDGVADDRGTTPLMDAASRGLTDLVKRLLAQGADLEVASRDGQTAVVLAVGNGQDESAAVLIEAGADVDKKDLLGMSARKYATLYKQTAILQAIQKREEKIGV